jgi:hypothetical protein
MKISAMITVFAVVGTANPIEAGEDSNLTVTVYVQDAIGDPRLTAMCPRAQGIASGMFATAGVHIRW